MFKKITSSIVILTFFFSSAIFANSVYAEKCKKAYGVYGVRNNQGCTCILTKEDINPNFTTCIASAINKFDDENPEYCPGNLTDMQLMNPYDTEVPGAENIKCNYKKNSIIAERVKTFMNDYRSRTAMSKDQCEA